MAAPPRPESLALLDRLMAALEAKGERAGRAITDFTLTRS